VSFRRACARAHPLLAPVRAAAVGHARWAAAARPSPVSPAACRGGHDPALDLVAPPPKVRWARGLVELLVAVEQTTPGRRRDAACEPSTRRLVGRDVESRGTPRPTRRRTERAVRGARPASS
jgi:hypothetical protein